MYYKLIEGNLCVLDTLAQGVFAIHYYLEEVWKLAALPENGDHQQRNDYLCHENTDYLLDISKQVEVVSSEYLRHLYAETSLPILRKLSEIGLNLLVLVGLL